MKRYFQNSVVLILLLSYTILGANGHFEKLAGLYFGTNSHKLVKADSTNPPATKVYWTQYKHIPTIIKISVPSPALIAPIELNYSYNISFFSLKEITRYYSSQNFCFILSRAPPII